MATGSFIFDPSKGETPETVAARRRTADALAARIFGRAPQNVGEGLNALGQAWIASTMRDEASSAQKAGQASAADAWKQFIMGGGEAPPAPIASGAAAPMGSMAIPSGEIDPRLKDAISNVASVHPEIDPAYMTRLALVENSGKVEGGSPLSTAQGPFQFINSTAKQYGLTNPADPAAAATAAARLTLDNKAALTQALGREPTPGELYLAHQQGAGGAIKLLQNPNAPVESVVGMQAARNNAGAPGMTAGQFANRWTGKFNDIVQTVDPNQKNIIDEQADMPVGAPTAVAGGAPPPVAEDGGASIPPNAQAAQGQLPTAQDVQAATQPQPKRSGYSVQQLMQLSANPWLNDGQRAAVNLMLKQELQQQDPMRGLQMDKLRADIAKTQRETAEGQSGVFGTPIYGKDPKTGKTVLGAITKNGNFKPLDTGGIEVTPGVTWQDFGTYRQGFDKSGQPVTPARPKENQAEATEKAFGAAEGKSRGEAAASYRSMSSKLPGLEKVVGELNKLADDATYTYAGRALDAGRQQLGMEPREAAIARTKYIAMVDNQILPLLRDTFGAQFTVQEGESLRATLGDPNKTPAEKKEVLSAFINQKRRDIEALALQSVVGTGDKRSPPAGTVTINGYKIEAVD